MIHTDDRHPRRTKYTGSPAGETHHRAELREEGMRERWEEAEETAAEHIDGNALLSRIHARIRRSMPV